MALAEEKRQLQFEQEKAALADEQWRVQIERDQLAARRKAAAEAAEAAAAEQQRAAQKAAAAARQRAAAAEQAARDEAAAQQRRLKAEAAAAAEDAAQIKAWVADGAGPTYTVNDVGEIADSKYQNDLTVVGRLIIKNGATKIGACAFAGRKITSAYIPNTVTSIGPYAFGLGCSLTSASIKRGTKYFDQSTYKNSFDPDCRLDFR